jgi:sigma-B regulation protein RsbU (phosphoserine phosphatase)
MASVSAVDKLIEAGAPSDQEDLVGLLAQLTHEFASSLNIGETLRAAIDRFIIYLDAEAGSIFLLEEDGSALVCRECAGPVDIVGVRLAPDEGIVGKTVRTRAAQIVRDVSENVDFAAGIDAGTGFVTRSILCAPLIVRGQCIGALELLNKRSGDGLFDGRDAQLVTAIASAAALAIHNARMAQALVEQERVRKELELAREIQKSLLPSDGRTDLPVYGLNIPAREVSGDFYDFIPLGDGRIYFNLADVSGKGMNAALLMAKTCSLLRCLAKSSASAGDLLAAVNREVCETASRGMFVTIVSGYIDRGRDSIELANAGHQPVLRRSADGRYREYAALAPPLGVLPELEFPMHRLPLRGGSLYLYTDGLPESSRGDGELGLAGLTRLIEQASGVPAPRRLEDIVRRLRDEGFRCDDDITLVLIEG